MKKPQLGKDAKKVVEEEKEWKGKGINMGEEGGKEKWRRGAKDGAET